MYFAMGLTPLPADAFRFAPVGRFPALTLDFQEPGSWGLKFQPLLPPSPSPWERDPSPSLAPPQPPQLVPGLPRGLLGSHTVQTSPDRAVGKGWWVPEG